MTPHHRKALGTEGLRLGVTIFERQRIGKVIENRQVPTDEEIWA